MKREKEGEDEGNWGKSEKEVREGDDEIDGGKGGETRGVRSKEDEGD